MAGNIIQRGRFICADPRIAVAEGRREIHLKRCVMVEAPRLISDEELADVLAAFVEQVRGAKVRPASPEPKVEAAPKRPNNGSGP